MSRKIIEKKRHLNKPDERYECEFLESEPGQLVIRYISDRKFASKRLGITFPPGCVTIALYWEVRSYVFWGIFSSEYELLGYLIHICKDVRISDKSVSYLDMLLDIWFFPDGRHIILDEDEVEECTESGVLNDSDREYIEKSREAAIADFGTNEKSLSEVLERLDISGQPK
jgi:hypothetical protein